MSDILILIIGSILVILLCVSIYYNIRFGLILLRIQDVIEDSLDVLDERHQSISHILTIPLFYDSREVRQVLKDIERSRDAVLDVARQLTTIEIEESAEPESVEPGEEAT